MTTSDGVNVRWTASTGLQILDGLWPHGATASTISGNGQVIFGVYYDRISYPSTDPLPARWDGTTLTLMAMPAGVPYPSPNLCSFDGSIAYTSFQGPIRWTNGGTTVSTMSILGHEGGQVADCNADGSMAVGSVFDGSINNYSYYNGVVWTNGTPSLLADSNQLGPIKITPDGSRILGTGLYPFGFRQIVYWQSGVMRNLTPYSPSGDYRGPDVFGQAAATGANAAITVVQGRADRLVEYSQGGTGTPVYWDSLDTVTVVQGSTYYGVIHDVAFPPGFVDVNVSATSDNGTIFAGTGVTNLQKTQPIKWVNNVPTVLPTLPVSFPGVPTQPGVGYAFACSADGSIVVGMVADLSIQFQPCYWDAANTLHVVPFPIPTPAFPFMTLLFPYQHSISRDGSVIAATGAVESIRDWAITSPTTTTGTGGVGDFWLDTSYVDFADPVTRAKFITPDGGWLSLGEHGDLPTGARPQFWQTIQPGNTPDDFLISYGASVQQWFIHLYGSNPVSGTPYPYELTFDECALTPPAANQFIMTDLSVNAIHVDNPMVYLRYSDDAGASWSNKLPDYLGKEGEFSDNIQWQRLGTGRFRVFEISWSAPVVTALTGVFVDTALAQT